MCQMSGIISRLRLRQHWKSRACGFTLFMHVISHMYRSNLLLHQRPIRRWILGYLQNENLATAVSDCHLSFGAELIKKILHVLRCFRFPCRNVSIMFSQIRPLNIVFRLVTGSLSDPGRMSCVQSRLWRPSVRSKKLDLKALDRVR